MSDRIDTDAVRERWKFASRMKYHGADTVLALCDEVDRLRAIALDLLDLLLDAEGYIGDYFWRKHYADDVAAHRAALGDQVAPTEPPMDPLSVIRRTVDDWRSALMTDDELIEAVCAAAAPQPAPVPERCPTCGSTDPQTCDYDGFHHEHGHIAGCCPDPWHASLVEGERG